LLCETQISLLPAHPLTGVVNHTCRNDMAATKMRRDKNLIPMHQRGGTWSNSTMLTRLPNK
jgi:hypothetical protein